LASGAADQRWHAIKTIAWGLSAVVLMSLFNWRFKAPIEYAEFGASDLRVNQQTTSTPSGIVVIATIDDRSIAQLGRFPWPRSLEARLVEALKDYQAAVVGFDIFFSEADPADVEREAISARLKAAGVKKGIIARTLGASNDLSFADAVREQGSTYFGYGFSSHMLHEPSGGDPSAYRRTFLTPPPLAYNIVRRERGSAGELMTASAYLAPIPALNRAARGIGYVDIDEDEDGVARSYPTIIRFNGRYCAPLFLALAQAYARNALLSLDLGPDGVSRVALGRRTIPVDESGRMMVHYRGPPGKAIHRYSVVDIINRRVAVPELRGKIVIVGVTAHALGDRFVTPVGGDFPGIEIQATALDNVLAGDFIHASRETFAEAIWAGRILGLAISVAAAFMTALSSAVVVVVLGLGYFQYATWRLTSDGALVGIVFPLSTLAVTYFVIVSYRYFVEGREKRYIRSAFELYVNPGYVASLIADSRVLKLGGERRHLSILFADILNFTARAEHSQPEPLVAMLNTYMTVMTDIILESGGVVDKLMGDGIMAFWGAPLPAKNPARDAVDCALRMLDQLKSLAQRDDRFGDVRIGIGISTGEAIVGNFGGERKFDYSVIGDTVNLASRLEGLTRQFNVNLLVNRQTHEEAGSGYVVREIGLVRVKGKDQLVPVVEIAGHEGDSIDPLYYQRFANAIALMQKGSSPEDDLRKLLDERPDDQVIAMCLERLKTPDGRPVREMVFEFGTK
jgi:adenylate cyclase